MEYFRLRQRGDLRNLPVLKNVHQAVDKRKLSPDMLASLPEVMFFKLSAPENALYPDILESGLFLVSQPLLEALEVYLPGLPYIITPLSDVEHDVHNMYYMPLFEQADCLSEYASFNLDRSVITKLVLDAKKIGDRAIFRVKHGVSQIIVARLDAAESILRRDFIGVSLERIIVI